MSDVRFGTWAYGACVVGDACVLCGMLTTVKIYSEHKTHHFVLTAVLTVVRISALAAK